MKATGIDEENKSLRKWTLDRAHSAIEFSVRHMMISTVKGKFRDFTVEAVGDPDHLDLTHVAVKIDPLSIDTGEEKRDAHLKSPDFFSAGEFKYITFETSSIEKTGEDEFNLNGALSIRGISREVQMKAELGGIMKDPLGNTRFGVTVTGEIMREDFGLKWNSILETGGVMVGSKVRFEASIEMFLPE
jgi:polyisoprenoid-binding protein YceI